MHVLLYKGIYIYIFKGYIIYIQNHRLFWHYSLDFSHSAKVYTFGWWMGMYGGKSPKRHRGYTNNPAAARLDLGVYKRSEQAKKKLETVRRYYTQDGRPAYVGTKSLRSTQPRAHFLSLNYRFDLSSINCVVKFDGNHGDPNQPMCSHRAKGIPSCLCQHDREDIR
jgi:hypothetical protein